MLCVFTLWVVYCVSWYSEGLTVHCSQSGWVKEIVHFVGFLFVCFFWFCLSLATTFCFGFSQLWNMFLFVLSLTIVVAFVGFLFEFEFCQFCSFYFILFVLYSLLVSTACVLLTRLPFLLWCLKVLLVLICEFDLILTDFFVFFSEIRLHIIYCIITWICFKQEAALFF